MLVTASVVAGDASAHTTTSTGNTISTEQVHLLVMRVLASGSMNARSKFARECDVACGQYCNLSRIAQISITCVLQIWWHYCYVASYVL